jgi:hypothetical protein
MKRTKIQECLVTRDNFMDVLALDQAKKFVRDRDHADGLYHVIVEVLNRTDTRKLSQANTSSYDLALRIPGTGIHVRLTNLLRDSLRDIVLCYLLLMGHGIEQPALASAALLTHLLQNLSKLRKDVGERCVVESIGEVENPTAEGICANLLDVNCRYPTAGCQFMVRSAICGLHLSATKETLAGLESRKIVEKTLAVEPYRWRVTG